ncbi:MAG: hypothetical protein CM15mP120_04080 [Pseudomonadota bacterium]|nr:MAG: hypothetical protein CM15mP120_04080 [Pseudomonadota bacterium]
MQSSQQASQIGFDYADEPLVALKPTREAGLQLLEQFLPKAGRLYQAHRNDDLGPTEHRNVSRLSPYLRRRLLSEQEVLAAVLSRHSNSDAFKFVQRSVLADLLEGLARAPSNVMAGLSGGPGGGSQPYAKQRVASGQLYARDHRTDGNTAV